MVPLFQPPGSDGPELDATEVDRFVADDDASLSQEILDIPMAELESIVEPDSIGDDIWRESVTCVGIHPPLLPILAG